MYTASCTVILKDGSLSYVTADGGTRNEALENLGNAATGINVVSALAGSIETHKS